MNKSTDLRRARRAVSPWTVLIYIFLIAMAAVMILPFLWMVVTSLKTQTEATTMDPFRLFPASPQWQNYAEPL